MSFYKIAKRENIIRILAIPTLILSFIIWATVNFASAEVVFIINVCVEVANRS